MSGSPLPNGDKVILKGGMLISSLIGVSSRTTMDLDTTVRGFALTHESAAEAFKEIIAADVDDDWSFEFLRTEDIRETGDYPGIRVHLLANYAPMAVPLTVDVTTGDKITPDAIEYDYPLLFDDKSIRLMAYPIETVLAEKLETVVSRGASNTRPRDFYDIHALWRLRVPSLDLVLLDDALVATSDKRGTREMMARWKRVLEDVQADGAMQGLWAKYAKANAYAADTTLQEACLSVLEVMRAIGW